MSLGKEQERFTKCLWRLLDYAESLGYEIRMGDVWSRIDCGAHKVNSQHYKKLAADLNLFKDGKFLTRTKDHYELGVFWESLDPKNRWGGRYNDGNHYERMERGWNKDREL